MVKLKGLGYVTVSSSGTPVPLSSSSVRTAACHIQADPSNTGVIYVGGVNLDATHRGVVLSPDRGTEITGPHIRGIEEEFDLSEVYIDAATSGDKVIVSYFERS
jgi:hypothetical protein